MTDNVAPSIQPVTPGEVTARKLAALPDEVIEVFNDLIAGNFSGNSATVTQEEVIAAFLERGVIREQKEAFSRHLLEVESVYRAAGWRVIYDKSGYNESYGAFFTFIRPLPGSKAGEKQ